MILHELLILAVSTLVLCLFTTQGIMSTVSALLLLAVIAIGLMWYFQDQMMQKMKNSEQTLKTQVRSSAKDISAKQNQIMTILQNIPSPLAMMDSYGHLIVYNEGFSRFISDENHHDITYRDLRINNEVRDFLKEAYLSESSLIRHLHFEDIDFQCLSIPIEEKGRFTGCLLIFQDITQAMEKERMQKRFIADASHELKTPIAAIKGMIEIINRDDFNDPETMKEFHIQIEKETRRLENIVQDLLKLSRLSKNNLVLNLEYCDLDRIFDQIVKEVKPQAEQKQIQLHTDNRTSSQILMDEEKIHQVLSNLVVNAIMHSQARHIWISAQVRNGRLVLAVKDDGCGIEMKYLDRIFERFYRIEKSRSRANGGSGLGLAIVKAIVSAHKGEIDVKSVVGKGTCFEISLPLRTRERQ